MTLTRPLRDDNARVVLQDCADVIAELLKSLPSARARLRDWSGGPIKSTPTDGSGGHAQGGHSDPVLAIIETGQPIDRAGDTLLALDRRIMQLREALYTLSAECARTLDARAPKDLNEGCELCGAFGVHTISLREHLRVEGEERARARCEWHTENVKLYGRDLHHSLTQFHLRYPDARRNHRTFVQLLREHDQDLWAKYHAGLTGATGAWEDKTA